MTFYLPAGCRDTNDIWWHYCSLFKSFNFKRAGLNYQPEYRLCISNDSLLHCSPLPLCVSVWGFLRFPCPAEESHSKLMWIFKAEGDTRGDAPQRTPHASGKHVKAVGPAPDQSALFPCSSSPDGITSDRACHHPPPTDAFAVTPPSTREMKAACLRVM